MVAAKTLSLTILRHGHALLTLSDLLIGNERREAEPRAEKQFAWPGLAFWLAEQTYRRDLLIFECKMSQSSDFPLEP